MFNFVIIYSDESPLEVAVEADDECAAIHEIAETYSLDGVVSITLKRAA